MTTPPCTRALTQAESARLEEQLFHGDGAWAENLNKYYVAPSRYLVSVGASNSTPRAAALVALRMSCKRGDR